MVLSFIDRLDALREGIDHRLAPALAAQGLATGEWRLLRALHRLGAVAPSALAEACGLTRGGVTRLVDRLRARRLVVRAAAGREDRRYQTIALTGAGASLAASLLATEAAAEAAVLDPLGARRRGQLIDILDALR
ncbi:MarR family winged helix-turn-helix transcriptional regulator [Sphingomonas sp.]|uniref:MarR family winged helix-turn-helix transcriptional regulator n=1 Tax=Sphingomonas sp. TaxID=28214 RepID=UPI002DD63ED8|nr:MarR family transcriptional regulator [Sphingomonas sp.]